MAKGTINFTKSKSNSNGTYIVGKIEWESTPVAGKNLSTVKVNLFVRKDNKSMTLTEKTDGTWSYELYINGEKHDGGYLKSVLTDWVQVVGYNFPSILHDADGSKSITISGSITGPTETSLEGLTTSIGDTTVELDKIQQAPKINSVQFAGGYVNGSISVSYTPQISTLYNRCIFSVNVDGKLTNIRTDDLGTKSATSQTYAPKFSEEQLSTIYSKVTKTDSAKIRVTFKAYSDSNYSKQVGSDQYKETSAKLPDDIVPTVSLEVKAVNSYSWLGKNYVAGLTEIQATATSQPGKSTDIAFTAIACNNVTYSGGAVRSFTVNIPPLNQTGEIALLASAMDLRSRYTVATKTITVLPYSAPVIKSVEIVRGTYDNGWTAKEDGEDIEVRFKTTLALADVGNTYDVTFKVDGSNKAPNHGDTHQLISGAECAVYFIGINGDASHSLTVTATDKTDNKGTVKLTIPTRHITIEFNNSGKGIAFGKTSEKDAFECAWPARFGDAVYIMDKITCPNAFSLRDFNINCNWADNEGHDLLVRKNDGLTVGLGWAGDDTHETVLDVRPKKANFQGVITAPRGRFTATNDLSGTEQKEPAIRSGDKAGQHIDIDTNEIQAKTDPTNPGPLYLNLDGGDVYAGGFRIPEIQRGSVRITPTAANTPTSFQITFDKEFTGTPTVIATPYTSVPGTTVVGVGVNGASKTGCTIWVTRTNTTETVVHWIAIY